MSVAAIALAVTGGLCELVGLGLVARGIVRDREQARDLFTNRRRRDPPKRSYPPPASPPPASSLMNPAFTASHNLRSIAESVTKFAAATHNAFLKLRQTLEAEFDDTTAEIWNGMYDADDELRGHLRYVLAGSIRDRWVGLGFLVAGIVLATAGSVVGTLS